jgi:hypothetical protein
METAQRGKGGHTKTLPQKQRGKNQKEKETEPQRDKRGKKTHIT